MKESKSCWTPDQYASKPAATPLLSSRQAKIYKLNPFGWCHFICLFKCFLERRTNIREQLEHPFLSKSRLPIDWCALFAPFFFQPWSLCLAGRQFRIKHLFKQKDSHAKGENNVIQNRGHPSQQTFFNSVGEQNCMHIFNLNPIPPNHIPAEGETRGWFQPSAAARPCKTTRHTFSMISFLKFYKIIKL